MRVLEDFRDRGRADGWGCVGSRGVCGSVVPIPDLLSWVQGEGGVRQSSSGVEGPGGFLLCPSFFFFLWFNPDCKNSCLANNVVRLLKGLLYLEKESKMDNLEVKFIVNLTLVLVSFYSWSAWIDVDRFTFLILKFRLEISVEKYSLENMHLKICFV